MVPVVKNLPANARDIRDSSSIPEWGGEGRRGKVPWRRKWQPTLVFLPGKFHGQGRLTGYNPRGPKESDTNEHTRHPY